MEKEMVTQFFLIKAAIIKDNYALDISSELSDTNALKRGRNSSLYLSYLKSYEQSRRHNNVDSIS